MTDANVELGLDIGLTYVTAAFREGREEPEPLPIGADRRQISVDSYAEDSAHAVPVPIWFRPDSGDRQQAVSSWRDLLMSNASSNDNGSSHEAGGTRRSAAVEFTASLVAWSVERANVQLGVPAHAVGLVTPTDWDPRVLSSFEEAIRRAGVERARIVTRAEAVASTFTRREGVMDGDLFAVVDVGGKTFEASVLHADGADLELVGPVVSRRGISGDAIDLALVEHVTRLLGLSGTFHARHRIDPSSDHAERLRLACRSAKEALSDEPSVTIDGAFPGQRAPIALTSRQLDSLAGPAVELILQAIRETISAADVTPHRLRALLLTGGSSRLPLLRWSVGRAFDVPTVVSAAPEADAALGATLVGGPGVGDTVPRSSLAKLTARPPASVPLGDPPSAATAPDTPAVAAVDAYNPSGSRRPSLSPPGMSADPAPEPAPDAATRPASVAGTARPWASWRVIGTAIACVVALIVVGLVLIVHLRNAPAAITGHHHAPPTKPTAPPTTQQSSSPPPKPAIFPLGAHSMVASLDHGRTASIVELSTTGGEPRVLVPEAAKGSPQPRSPNIAPDRKSIAYVMALKNGAAGTPWIARANPSRPFTVSTHRLFAPGSAAPCRTTTRPSYSPNGSLLAVICTGAPGHASGLYIVNASTGRDAHLVYSASKATPRLDLHSSPTWIGSDAIAFQARTGAGPDEIWTVHVNGSGTAVLQTRSIAGWNSHADWSSDGGLLVLNQRTVTKSGHRVAQTVVLIRKNGASTFVPVPNTTGAKAPCWSPSGDEIEFLIKNRIFTMQIDGSSRRTVAIRGPGHPKELAWGTR
jgi:hypothetical protein